MDVRGLVAAAALWMAVGAVWASDERVMAGRGVVETIDAESGRIVIRHEAISNYMAAMTMPFNVKNTNELAAARPGDEIGFQLHVTATDSWVDNIRGEAGGHLALPEAVKPATPVASSTSLLMDCQLTNELGRAMRVSDFRGQALAITFFYTRCPLPDFCPRLSKNFQEASSQLAAMTNAPGNWHFLSVTFDPKNDTPAALKEYARRYDYDASRWSFLTGGQEQIAAVARSVGVKYKEDGGTINHNFRTVIVNAAGEIQMVFPTGGNLSEPIVEEMLKAAAATSQPMAENEK